MTSLLFALPLELMAAEIDVFSLDIDELAKIKISTAARTSHTTEDAPASITVIDKQQLLRSGKRRWFEVIESATAWIGVNSFNSTKTFVVRGINTENGVLVLINGVAVNDPFSGRFEIFDLPIEVIERIEVVRGPGSAMFGGNALMGVINIVTDESQLNPVQSSLDYSVGNHDYYSTSAQFATKLLDEQISVNATFSHNQQQGESIFIEQDRLYTPTPGRYLPPLTNPSLTPTSRQENRIATAFRSEIKWQDFTAHYFFGRTESTPLLSIRGAVTEIDQTLKVDALNLFTLSYFGWHGNNWSFTPKVHYQINQEKSLGDSEPPQILGDDNQDGLNETFLSGIIESFVHDTHQYGIELQWAWNADHSHRFYAGLSFDESDLVRAEKQSNASFQSRSAIALFPIADMTSEFIDENISRRATAVSFEYRWQFIEHWALTSGLRYNRFSDFGDTHTPRLALTYTPNQRWYHKWLYATAFVPPAFNQLYDRTPTLSAFRHRGNADLNATELESFEWITGRTLDSKHRIELSASRNHTNNEIFFDRQAGIERWQNGGERSTRAIDFTWFWSPTTEYELSLNYAYQRPLVEDSSINGADIYPHHRATIAFLINKEQWEINTFLRAFSSSHRSSNDTRPSIDEVFYFDANIRLKDVYPFDRVQLSLLNIFNANGVDPTTPTDGLAKDMPRSGREMWCTVGFSW